MSLAGIREPASNRKTHMAVNKAVPICNLVSPKAATCLNCFMANLEDSSLKGSFTTNENYCWKIHRSESGGNMIFNWMLTSSRREELEKHHGQGQHDTRHYHVHHVV